MNNSTRSSGNNTNERREDNTPHTALATGSASVGVSTDSPSRSEPVVADEIWSCREQGENEPNRVVSILPNEATGITRSRNDSKIISPAVRDVTSLSSALIAQFKIDEVMKDVQEDVNATNLKDSRISRRHDAGNDSLGDNVEISNVHIVSSNSRITAKFFALGFSENMIGAQTTTDVRALAPGFFHEAGPGSALTSENLAMKSRVKRNENAVEEGLTLFPSVLNSSNIFAEAVVLGAELETSFMLPIQPLNVSANDATHTIVPPSTAEEIFHGTAKSSNSERQLKMKRWGLRLAVLVFLLAGISTAATCGIVGCAPSTGTSQNNVPPTDLLPRPMSPRETSMTAFINNVTLTERSIMAPENVTRDDHSEDRALAWLVQDDSMTLNLDTAIDRSRLQQRYAMATLWVNQVHYLANLTGHECDWEGVTCQAINTSSDVTTDTTLLIVTEISLGEVALRGTFSPDLGLLTHLEQLRMVDSELEGSLPHSIGRWSSMKYFHVIENSLTGALPESIGEWTALEVFNVKVNKFTGTLPTTIGRWLNLTFFDVGRNSMKGSLPESIGAWTNLRILNLERNELTGSLPDSIGHWTALRELRIDYNSFTGTLPFGQWTRMWYFNAESNMLTGPLPLSISNWTSIEEAFFEKNNFTGTVPNGICNQANLTKIAVDCNSDVSCDCCTIC